MLYSFRQGCANIWRNKMFSLASVATMSACIFLFGLIFIIVINVQEIVHDAEQSVTITVFFDEGTSDERIEEIGEEILAMDGVIGLKFASAEEALEEYIDEYMAGNEAAAEGLGEDNPLINSANYEVYMEDISEQATLAGAIEEMDDVRQVNQSVIAANILTDFNRLLAYASIVVMAILLAVAVFLISNTIRVGIAVRSEEISIMKLIGASNLFVRAPYMIEGVLIGLMGSIIPLILLYFMYKKIISYIMTNFSFLADIMSLLTVKQVYFYLLPVSLLLGAGIGLLGGALTVRKHLQV